MLLTIKNWIDQNIFGKDVSTGKAVGVRYKFNNPSLRNFHLLPHNGKKQFLNTFKPYWENASSFSNRMARQLR
ncbi:MAG: hypothetical protein Q8J88_01720 [Bacteroidales bacterium]|nr:hypothetical protein [Bacteroidales bacterium]